MRQAIDRFMDKVVVITDGRIGCWIWNADRDRNGYGRFYHNGPRQAHRWIFIYTYGPIPEGLVIDHTCREPACVNPDHMEMVSNRENIQRGFRDRKGIPRSS